MARRSLLSAWIVLILASSSTGAQTTAGTSATIVVPVVAQTGSFASEVTAYNPNGGAVTVNVSFYDAQNTASPGLKPCTPLALPAGQSVPFQVALHCALPVGSNFGLLILAESTGTQRFYGYARTQTPGGIGFSTEGFPIENFNDQLQHATGLKRVAAAGSLPAFQTNCFVGTLGDAVSYELRLFNGTTNAQIGSTLSGSLAPYQQYRYLDVFAQAGAPAGDLTNVRAQFTNLTATNKKLIGFCTVQENTNFSADFRIAKSYGGMPQNAFVQGGNAFGTTALAGTLDNQPLVLLTNNQPTLRLVPSTDATNTNTVNVINGSPLNTVSAGVVGGTIAGGAGTQGGTTNLPNQVMASYGTVSGGLNNLAAGASVSQGFATVGGGLSNTAGNTSATVAGGNTNIASGNSATIGGGVLNQATGDISFVGGGEFNQASGGFATVGGGYQNNNGSTAGYASTIAGGYQNESEGDYGAIGGGYQNTASGGDSTVGGGFGNSAVGQYSTVVGGQSNAASGNYSTIAGGSFNQASGSSSFAAGTFSKAGSTGEFVWADFHGNYFDPHQNSSNPLGWADPTNTFNVRATGGIWFVSGVNGAAEPTIGVAVQPNMGAWNTTSDRNVKENFQPVDVASILAKVVLLPIQTWRYIGVTWGPLRKTFERPSVSATTTRRLQPSIPMVSRWRRFKACISSCRKRIRVSRSSNAKSRKCAASWRR